MTEPFLEKIGKTVMEGEAETTKNLANEAIKTGLDPLNVINGIVRALKVIGEKFERREAFLPELIMAGQAAQEGVNILKTEIVKTGKSIKYMGKVVIGTVEGDIHDVGKSIVAALLVSSGFDVHDLGVDVPPDAFIRKIREVNADIVGLSALVTTTLVGQKHVIEALKKVGLRENVKVIIGGAPVTEEWARIIGADAYATDAIEGVEKIKLLLKR